MWRETASRILKLFWGWWGFGGGVELQAEKSATGGVSESAYITAAGGCGALAAAPVRHRAAGGRGRQLGCCRHGVANPGAGGGARGPPAGPRAGQLLGRRTCYELCGCVGNGDGQSASQSINRPVWLPVRRELAWGGMGELNYQIMF
eukprot:COSAG06_NODE_24_length_32981_cov_25.509671_2_plen_147_part_00